MSDKTTQTDLIAQSKALQEFKDSKAYELFKSDFEPLVKQATNTLIDATPYDIATLVQREQMTGELRQLTYINEWFEVRHKGILKEIKQNKEDND